MSSPRPSRPCPPPVRASHACPDRGTTRTERRWLWLPSTLVAGTIAAVGAIAGGLASCDSTAKFSLPDVKFHDVQVVSAFPAFIDEQGNVTRVCGAPLEGEADLEPNALELVVNFTSTERKNSACRNAPRTTEVDVEWDRDLGIKEGELIELTRVKSTQPGSTVGPSAFELKVDCVEGHSPGDKGACGSPLAEITVQATRVRYDKIADRCHEETPATWQSVAVVVDHSGSVSGLVDSNTLLEEQPAKVKFPSPLGLEHKSDHYNTRISAAVGLVESLNDRDRAIAYYYDEKAGVQVACSDSKSCAGGANDSGKCTTDKQCGAGSAGCIEDPSLANDQFQDLPFKGGDANQQTTCFASGKDPLKREWIKLGLDHKAKFDGSGRAPLWQAVDSAYTFLTGSSTDGNAGLTGASPKHIVVLVDGPDTCTESEQFNYTDLAGAGQCRIKCANAEIDYTALVNKMHGAGWPVHLHFVHWQAPAYKQPDARLMELACRSQGTYQFLNTEEINKSNPNEYQTRLTSAVNRVRNSLGGTWRPTFPLANLPDVAKVGQVTALQGSLRFLNPKFDSLDSVYQHSDSWRFGFQGQADHRLLFRRSCKTSADCGGSSECGENHCDGAGLCNPSPAKNQLPCGIGNSRCCGGQCAQGDCANACK